jgi:drug/metabolite transporter (DMT)-like permease
VHGRRLRDLLPHPAAAGASGLLPVTLLIPVSAVLLGMTLPGERLDPRQFAGMA